jgi:hypothetical protein
MRHISLLANLHDAEVYTEITPVPPHQLSAPFPSDAPRRQTFSCRICVFCRRAQRRARAERPGPSSLPLPGPSADLPPDADGLSELSYGSGADDGDDAELDGIDEPY